MNRVTLAVYGLILVLLLVISMINTHWQRAVDTCTETAYEITIVKTVGSDYRIVEYDGELYWQSRNHNYLTGDYWIMGGKLK